MAYVYCIKNIVNGKRYIGLTTQNIKLRMSSHLHQLRSGKHWNQHLQASWRKHGDCKFVVNMLKRCSRQSVNGWEQYYIRLFNSSDKTKGYNKSSGGDRPVFTAEYRAKLSKALKGRKANAYAIQRAREWHLGRPLSEEAKKKLSVFWLGKPKPKTPEHRAKLSLALMGKSGLRNRPSVTDFFRKCPICEKVVYHLNQKQLAKAIKYGYNCRSCAMKMKMKVNLCKTVKVIKEESSPSASSSPTGTRLTGAVPRR